MIRLLREIWLKIAFVELQTALNEVLNKANLQLHSKNIIVLRSTLSPIMHAQKRTTSFHDTFHDIVLHMISLAHTESFIRINSWEEQGHFYFEFIEEDSVPTPMRRNRISSLKTKFNDIDIVEDDNIGHTVKVRFTKKAESTPAQPSRRPHDLCTKETL